MTHSNVVDIGERETHSCFNLVPVFDVDAVFTPGVASRFLDSVKEFGIGVVEATDFHELPFWAEVLRTWSHSSCPRLNSRSVQVQGESPNSIAATSDKPDMAAITGANRFNYRLPRTD